MMCKCIMVKVGRSQKTNRMRIGIFINFAEIVGNVDYTSLGGWTALDAPGFWFCRAVFDLTEFVGLCFRRRFRQDWS